MTRSRPRREVAAVAQCVANKFRQTGLFPAPKGGCIDATVPMNFVPGGK